MRYQSLWQASLGLGAVAQSFSLGSRDDDDDPLVLLSPQDISQCATARFAWKGGVGPYSLALSASPGSGTNSPVPTHSPTTWTLEYSGISATSLEMQLPVQSGWQLALNISCSEYHVPTSLLVDSSDSSGCLPSTNSTSGDDPPAPSGNSSIPPIFLSSFNNIASCEETAISWTNGQAPYSLRVEALNLPSPFSISFIITDTNQITFKPPFPPETLVEISVIDAAQRIAESGPVMIANSSDLTCLLQVGTGPQPTTAPSPSSTFSTSLTFSTSSSSSRTSESAAATNKSAISERDSQTGYIIGGTLGGISFVFIAAVLLFMYYRRSRRNRWIRETNQRTPSIVIQHPQFTSPNSLASIRTEDVRSQADPGGIHTSEMLDAHARANNRLQEDFSQSGHGHLDDDDSNRIPSRQNYFGHIPTPDLIGSANLMSRPGRVA